MCSQCQPSYEIVKVGEIGGRCIYDVKPFVSKAPVNFDISKLTTGASSNLTPVITAAKNSPETEAEGSQERL